MANLFPMFVRLEEWKCLVVGAGQIAEPKIEGLLASGAEVLVVSPQATERIRQWAAAGRLRWEARAFVPSDIAGVALVISATGNAAVNEAVFRIASERRVLCNAVDDPRHCHFHTPAVVRRGQLQIAISTGGSSPALAQRLRQELEHRFGPDYAEWLESLAAHRRLLLRTEVDADQRRAALHHAASHQSYERFVAGKHRRQRSAWVGKVFIVGAGPGDPDLLTIKAARLLAGADIVLHDALISPAVLGLISRSATIINVGKRCDHKLLTQNEINSLLVFYAKSGNAVVRLKGGDPSIFGRLGEELETLNNAGIDVEIVPGITSALAGAAAARVPLTDRRVASSVVFLTAQRQNGQIREWRSLLATGSTLAIYMPGRHSEIMAKELIAAGMPPDTPCVLVSSASLPEQEIRSATLRSITASGELAAPTLVIVGQCARAFSQRRRACA